jgi:hypothetical protein
MQLLTFYTTLYKKTEDFINPQLQGPLKEDQTFNNHFDSILHKNMN